MVKKMFDKLESVVNRYEQIGMELTRPDIASNNELFRKLMKEHSDLTPIVEKYREYEDTEADIEAFCMGLPRYKRPKRIIFASVPRNPTGKIEKPLLRKKYAGERLVEIQTKS